MRSKEATKEKIIEAAKVLLARDGFAELKVNSLAKEAGVGKPLIYRYFTDIDGVIRALAKEAGLGQGGTQKSQTPMSVLDAEKALLNLLTGGRELAANRLKRDLLLWSLASDKVNGVVPDIFSFDPSLKEVEQITSDKDDGAKDKQAVYAILKAAIAFIVLSRDRHDSWAGLPIKSPNDMAQLEMALAKIIAKVWV